MAGLTREKYTSDQCRLAQENARVKTFGQSGMFTINIGPDPLFPEFDLICDG